MSVAEPLRHKGRLEVHVKAQFLAAYTAEILKNQNIFNPDVDKNLIDRIRNCSIDIYVKAWQKVDQSYQCWRECASKGDGYMMLRNMDRYYQGLWKGAAYESS